MKRYSTITRWRPVVAWGIFCALLPLASAAIGAEYRERLVDDMLVMDAAGEPADKAAVLRMAILWEDGVLPLVFSRSITPEQKRAVFAACAEWSAVARVRCVEGRYKGRSLRVGQAFNACWALWGMGAHALGVRRRMNLADPCFRRATLLHELGHAFGLIHEHQRPDRDRYVTLHPENMKRGVFGLNAEINFDRQQMKLETPYDFYSIMHYSRRSFSKNGKDTIVPLPQYSEYINVIGRVGRISALDAKAMVNAYGSPY